jgi:hypothetical protein
MGKSLHRQRITIVNELRDGFAQRHELRHDVLQNALPRREPTLSGPGVVALGLFAGIHNR